MAAGERHAQDPESERPHAPAPASAPAPAPALALATDFTAVLRHLRARGEPCAPPSGVGSFLPLYANDVEVVVWYLPAREGHVPGEVAIPCARLAAAWARLVAGARLTREALEAEGERPGRALWLLALLAQVPGARTQADPLAVWWEPPTDAPAAEMSTQAAGRRAVKATPGKRRRRAVRQPRPPSPEVMAAPPSRRRP